MSVGGRAPGRPRSAEADAAIVRATLEVLREEGFRGLSVEAVRARACVGKATIYRRFCDKEALARAAIASVSPHTPELPDLGDVQADLGALLRMTYAQAVDRRTATFAPRLLAESAGDPELHALVRETLIEPRREAVRRVLVRAAARGELRRDIDVDQVIDLIAGPLVYRLLIDGGSLEGLEPRIEAVVDAVLNGVRRR